MSLHLAGTLFYPRGPAPGAVRVFMHLGGFRSTKFIYEVRGYTRSHSVIRVFGDNHWVDRFASHRFSNHSWSGWPGTRQSAVLSFQWDQRKGSLRIGLREIEHPDHWVDVVFCYSPNTTVGPLSPRSYPLLFPTSAEFTQEGIWALWCPAGPSTDPLSLVAPDGQSWAALPVTYESLRGRPSASIDAPSYQWVHYDALLDTPIGVPTNPPGYQVSLDETRLGRHDSVGSVPPFGDPADRLVIRCVGDTARDAACPIACGPPPGRRPDVETDVGSDSNRDRTGQSDPSSSDRPAKRTRSVATRRAKSTGGSSSEN